MRPNGLYNISNGRYCISNHAYGLLPFHSTNTLLHYNAYLSLIMQSVITFQLILKDNIMHCMIYQKETRPSCKTELLHYITAKTDYAGK